MLARSIPAALIAWAVLALACSNSSDEPLPPLIAPVERSHGSIDESMLLRAHVAQFMRSQKANDDMNFDYEFHVLRQLMWLNEGLYRWGEALDSFDHWEDYDIERILALTPEAARYRGGRQRAVALGLMALSLWRRNPPRYDPTGEDLQRCASFANKDPLCRVGPRARAQALRRAMLMADYADKKLFRKLARESAEKERRNGR